MSTISTYDSSTKSTSSAFLIRTVLALNSSDIGHLLDIQQSCHARQKTLSESGVTANDVGVFALLDILDEKRSVVLGETLVFRLR